MSFGGGGSGSSGSSSSVSVNSSKYSDTTTKNPYVTSRTTNKGTTTDFQPNTSLSDIFNFTNSSVGDLLNQYLNPTTENPVQQAQLEQYQRNLNESTRQALENNVIAPLAQRNMIRSSQATDLYNTLNKENQKSLDEYNTQLLTNSRKETEDMINTLMNLVYQGWNVVNGNQAQSLNTSSGNKTTTTTTNGNSSSNGWSSAFKF